MENAADALKMAGFMLIFIAALSLAMTTLSKAKSAATAIIYSNNARNGYMYLEDDGTTYPMDDAPGGTRTNRLVGIDVIIPTIYKYSQESYKIEFYKQNGEPLDIVPTSRLNSYTDENGKQHGLQPFRKKDGSIVNVCFVNFFDLTWEQGQTKSLEEIEYVIEKLQTDYTNSKFVEQMDEVVNQQAVENETTKYDQYVTKDEEEKAEDEVRIISYTLR